jgi:hypothetical protein
MSDPRYGSPHQRLRKALMAGLRASSEGVRCAHDCGVPIAPNTPSYLIDLAHEPGTDGYRGLAHSHCNRSDGAHDERRVGRPPAGARFGQSRAVANTSAPRVTYEEMEAGYEVEHFGRTGVAEGETTTDSQGRKWIKTGHIVVQQWWA